MSRTHHPAEKGTMLAYRRWRRRNLDPSAHRADRQSARAEVAAEIEEMAREADEEARIEHARKLLEYDRDFYAEMYDLRVEDWHWEVASEYEEEYERYYWDDEYSDYDPYPNTPASWLAGDVFLDEDVEEYYWYEDDGYDSWDDWDAEYLDPPPPPRGPTTRDLAKGRRARRRKQAFRKSP